ncbi:hypothetical protein ACPXB3_22280 [Gordonia sp. DT219]|uniref:hypothetical protein n=1 Tax=Gordonia sp. DT219 TaxID=3416658 RepID=UPI003CE8A30E
MHRDAARLVRERIADNHPAAVKTALRLKASELIHDGTSPEIVAEALDRWSVKSGVGPGILPSLVSDVLKDRSGSGARAVGAATTKANGWLEIANAAALTHDDQKAIGQ